MPDLKLTRGLAILALMAPLTLAACGDDDDDAAIDTDGDGDAEVIVEGTDG